MHDLYPYNFLLASAQIVSSNKVDLKSGLSFPRGLIGSKIRVEYCFARSNSYLD